MIIGQELGLFQGHRATVPGVCVRHVACDAAAPMYENQAKVVARKTWLTVSQNAS